MTGFGPKRVEWVLGPPMTLPNAPQTRTWSCPVCRVGPDSLLLRDDGRVHCTLGHSQDEIVAAIEVLHDAREVVEDYARRLTWEVP